MTASRLAPARRRPAWAKPFSAAHIALYRATGGVIGYWLGTQRALLLTTTGRKSGQPRTQPLTYFALEGALALVASNWGSGAPPDWYLNLVARPSARVQLRREVFPVAAAIATADERARLWPEVVARLPIYGYYQARIPREIPIVLLRRDG
ncbi:MAG TPA: nitroreductase/quinone reductase family protein [Ktedonobacterales bacterium]|nr:nitroreductase/quinone reductase family protein [Ktedonobacterales bacterium]